ncbi:hypothetical protein IPZ58_28060 [Streptomyces roseoverticillatus]|uniref:hypothetical protein n=1 Tax=Streptomyces roseoverticillatus TaxID=66429 RepID=UPI001F27AE0D|nr:hypothetical protein [Streptomyces roseoverticillatus]MCF3105416.1 hypothetical protein [Streptomyces roseoverticillatus]
MSTKRRLRSKRTNGREALRLSTVKPEEFNVRPGEQMAMVCQDCRAWYRIDGVATLRVAEHCGTDRGHGEPDDGCPGSNRLVVVDIDVKAWQARQDRLIRDAMPAENRRAARQFHKPLAAPPVPVHRIAAPRPAERKASRAAQWRRVDAAVRRTDARRLEHTIAGVPPSGGPDLTTDTIRRVRAARQP